MAGKSFYDLDYVIEMNEQRLEQYTTAYEKVSGQLTNIFVIYSAMAIFWVPMVREVFWGEDRSEWMIGCFIFFAGLFGISVFYTVRLIIPNALGLISRPAQYYRELMDIFEKHHTKRRAVEDLLKLSYIYELQKMVDWNRDIILRKHAFYRDALVLALWAAVPYICCLGNLIANQKVS